MCSLALKIAALAAAMLTATGAANAALVCTPMKDRPAPGRQSPQLAGAWLLQAIAYTYESGTDQYNSESFTCRVVVNSFGQITSAACKAQGQSAPRPTIALTGKFIVASGCQLGGTVTVTLNGIATQANVSGAVSQPPAANKAASLAIGEFVLTDAAIAFRNPFTLTQTY